MFKPNWFIYSDFFTPPKANLFTFQVRTCFQFTFQRLHITHTSRCTLSFTASIRFLFDCIASHRFVQLVCVGLVSSKINLHFVCTTMTSTSYRLFYTDYHIYQQTSFVNVLTNRLCVCLELCWLILCHSLIEWYGGEERNNNFSNRIYCCYFFSNMSYFHVYEELRFLYTIRSIQLVSDKSMIRIKMHS